MYSGYSITLRHQKAGGLVAYSNYVVHVAPGIHLPFVHSCSCCDALQDERQLLLSGATSGVRDWLARSALLSQAESPQAGRPAAPRHGVELVLAHGP